MKRFMLWVAAAALCSSATNAHANFACRAKPADFLGIDAGGTVLVSIVGVGRVKLCNLQLDHGGITDKVCAGWYSTFLSARMVKSEVAVYFDESTPLNAGATSCATLGEWTNRVPYFIEFQP